MSEQISIQFPSQTLKERDAAQYLGMSRIWLSQSRMRGTGPEYIKIGRTIRYAVSDLDDYLKSHRVRRFKY